MSLEPSAVVGPGPGPKLFAPVSDGAARQAGAVERVVVIDNYDSFTFNLVQVLVTLGVEVEVFRNDDLSTAELAQRPVLARVLSPGPGRPEAAGICVELLETREDVPTLGVCLGHQALAHAFGGRVDAAPILMHGKTSAVHFDDDPLFEGIAQHFVATRYHSLCVDPASVPAELEPFAWSDDDGVIMALRHRALPYWGVQFHPESVLTDQGPRILSNFINLARRHVAQQRALTSHP